MSLLFLAGFYRVASHILQFIFLGNTGFKWPVAYFPTIEAHASELYLIVFDVINKLSTYGFKVCSKPKIHSVGNNFVDQNLPIKIVNISIEKNNG